MTGTAIIIANITIGNQIGVAVLSANLATRVANGNGIFEAGSCLLSTLNSLNV
jgi:hypothetical protein